MYRNLFGILAVFAVALVLVGITFSGTAEERADYVFVNGSEPKSLDPQVFTGQLEGRIGDAIFEGLTFRDNETLKPRPGQAESREVSPDGKRWTFHMREGIRWSNGDPVTANDFVYSWVRLQEPEIAAEYAYLMHMVEHAEAYNTYGAHVLALEGDPAGEDDAAKEGLLRGFEALLAKSGKGLPASAWQRFVDGRSLRDSVTKTADPTILAALARTEGTLTPEEGSALLAALKAETIRRKTALAAAKAHFGKDEGAFAPDAKTFVVELKAYTPYFLELTAFYPTYPVHRATVERWPGKWFREGRIVTNGPFLLESWTLNKRIRLRKNPAYWDAKAVSLETVDALPIDNRTTAFNLYMTGAVDWLPSSYPGDLIDIIKKRPDFYGSAGLATYFYRLNCTKKPFDDPRVRKALALAFDRKVIVEDLTRKGEIPCTTLVPPGIDGYESPDGLPIYDPEGARALLAEAGFPGGKGFPEFSIVHNTDDMHKKIAERIAEEWRKTLGIHATTVNKEWQAIMEDVRRLNFEVERAGWVGDYADPNTFLDMFLTKGGNNQTGWGDPFYDRLVQLAADPMSVVDLPPADLEALLGRMKERKKAEAHLAAVRGAPDREARLAAAAKLRFHLFREAEAILCRDAMPIIPIYFYFYSGLVSPDVQGFHGELEIGGKKLPDLQDLHPFRDVRVRRARGASDAR